MRKLLQQIGVKARRAAPHPHNRFMAFTLIVFLSVALAACGSITPTIVEPIADIQLPPPGTFAVTVTGGIDAEFSGTGEVVTAPNMGRAIYLTGDRYSANLVLPGDQTTGTFSVSPLLSVFNAAQSVIAVGGVLIDSQGAAEENTAGTEERPLITALLPVHLYDQVSSGRVTLLSIAPISGAFEFTAADENGRTVTVRAVFAELSEEIDSP